MHSKEIRKGDLILDHVYSLLKWAILRDCSNCDTRGSMRDPWRKTRSIERSMIDAAADKPKFRSSKTAGSRQ